MDPGRWQSWHFSCRMGAISFANVGGAELPTSPAVKEVDAAKNADSAETLSTKIRLVNRLLTFWFLSDCRWEQTNQQLNGARRPLGRQHQSRIRSTEPPKTEVTTGAGFRKAKYDANRLFAVRQQGQRRPVEHSRVTTGNRRFEDTSFTSQARSAAECLRCSPRRCGKRSTSRRPLLPIEMPHQRSSRSNHSAPFTPSARDCYTTLQSDWLIIQSIFSSCQQ